MFLNFCALFSTCTFLRLIFFSCLVVISSQLIFSVAVHIYRIDIFDEAFSLLTIRIPNGYQTLQSGDPLRGALTYKYACHLNGVIF